MPSIAMFFLVLLPMLALPGSISSSAQHQFKCAASSQQSVQVSSEQ